MQLDQKNVLLGVSGGIAAYKTPDLVRKLKAKGANVRVVLTDSATHFVSSLSLQAVCGNKVHQTLLDEDAEAGMGHIELAKWADFFLVAPATANTIAKLTHGLADDLLTTLALATQAETFVAPAMNQQMWSAQVTGDNVARLTRRGVHILGPAQGEQACGDTGYGRMLEPQELADAIECFSCKQDTFPILDGLKILITAGPTREAIDPVRYLSNHSSGKMGFALAKAAVQLGAEVTLVSGPVNIETPMSVIRHDVESAQQMHDVVHENIAQQHIFIACAAVADYKVDKINTHKMKKDAQQPGLTLNFTENPDILKSVATLRNAPFTLGFAAETQNVELYAKSKMEKKNLNMIAANDVSNSDLGFNSDKNALIVLSENERYSLSPKSKDSLAIELLELLHKEYQNRI